MLSAEAKLRRIYFDRGLNNSWCHAKAESNNCFIINLKTSETYKTIKRSLLMFQANLLWAILFILFLRAFEFELLAAQGLGHNCVQ
jgi:hypothetical protein